MDDYNYATFRMDEGMEHFAAFANGPRVGSRAPDFPTEDLVSGDVVKMSSLWSRSVAVLEFGSLT